MRVPFLGEETGILHFVQLSVMSSGSEAPGRPLIPLVAVAYRTSHTAYAPRFIGCPDPEFEYH